MRITILSENQYEPRFITPARTKAISAPPRPPRASPAHRRTAVSKDMRRRVRRVFFMGLLSRKAGAGESAR